jgi:hypothetical protein
MSDHVLISTGIPVFGTVFILFFCWKASQHRKNALFIISLRPALKISVEILLTLLAIWSIAIFPFPHSLAISTFLLSCALGVFFLDAIVKDDGIYYGIFIPFNKIEKISDGFGYVLIETDRKVFRYHIFYKLLYKFTPEDIKRIKTLVKGGR